MTQIHVSQRGNSKPRISQETIDAVLSVPILDLASAMGDTPIRKGKQYAIPCPDPNHTENVSDNAYIEPNKNVFKCFSCMVGGNHAVAFYSYKTYGEYDAKKHFIPSIKAVAELMGIQIKNEDGTIALPGASEPQHRFVKAVELEPKEPKILDIVYRAFLNLCPIRQNHLDEWVTKRRYSKDDIQTMLLRSVPTADEWKSIYQTLHDLGYPLERIPGFAERFVPEFYEECNLELGSGLESLKINGKDTKGTWLYTPSTFASGYFIPVRDENGYIIRLRICQDNGNPKYIWFSSEHNVQTETKLPYIRRNGTSSGTPHSVSVPFNVLKQWQPGTHVSNVISIKEMIITEGEHKSQISANFFNRYVRGLAGIGNFATLLDEIRGLKESGLEKVIIAIDMDTLEKEDDSIKSEKKQKNLFKILKTFAAELLKLDVTCCLWTWNLQHGKGLDDLVYNRKLPIEINLRTGQRQTVKI